MQATNEQIVADHHMRVDTVSSKPKKVLVVVSNPAVASTVGWAVGFWGAELTHPYYELTERGVEVTIASPDGGRVQMDALSNPRDPSKWSSEDLITMGFVNTPELMGLLENTPRLADLELGELDAIMVAGGLAPMFTFRENEHVLGALRYFTKPRSRLVSTATARRRSWISSSPTAPTWSRARRSRAFRTSRRTSATASSGNM